MTKKKTTEQKLKEYREHSKYCVICGKENLFDGCSINLVSISESGQIVTPYETENSSMNVIMPLCMYHMILAQEGIIAVTTQNQFIQSKILTQLEPQLDKELRKLILKIGRGKKDKLSTATKNVAKILIQARKIQSDMDKKSKEKKDAK